MTTTRVDADKMAQIENLAVILWGMSQYGGLARIVAGTRIMVELPVVPRDEEG